MRVFEMRLSAFYATHNKSVPDPSNGLKPVTVDV